MKWMIRLAVMVAVVGGILYLLHLSGCFKKQQEVIPIGTIDTIRAVNKAGDSVISLKGNEQTFGIIEKRIADSIANVYDTKVKNLKEIIIAQTRTITHLSSSGPTEIDFKPVKVGEGNKDCPPEIAALRKLFSSPWYKLDVQIGITDTSFANIESYDTITGVWKTVKEGSFFKRKKYLQLDLSFADPGRHVTGLMAYRTPNPKPKKFGIGISSGITYNGKFKPYIGVGVHWNFIRF